MTIERRAAFELRADGRRVTGYASVWNAKADLGQFTEMVLPGAFTRSLAGSSDPIALYQHEAGNILGRRSAGTLQLAEDERGLRYTIDLPDTTLGRDIRELVGRGDIRGASIGFRVPADGETWSVAGSGALRTLSAIDLLEVSLTPVPAFPDTSAALRSLRALSVADARFARVQRWLLTCD